MTVGEQDKNTGTVQDFTTKGAKRRPLLAYLGDAVNLALLFGLVPRKQR